MLEVEIGGDMRAHAPAREERLARELVVTATGRDPTADAHPKSGPRNSTSVGRESQLQHPPEPAWIDLPALEHVERISDST